jgi:beta-lactamase class A
MKLKQGLAALLLLAVTLVAAPARAANDGGLQTSIDNYLADKTGHYSVTALELGGSNRSVHINGSTTVDPASIFKLYYAWLALEKIQQGNLGYATKLVSGYQLGTCLKLMISYSDNYCTVDIRAKLGNDYVNTRLADLGLADSRIVLDSHGKYVTKETTTDDVATFLAKLHGGELLSTIYTAKFIEYLKAQIWRARISSALPVGTQVASKSGNLLVDSGMIEGDSAIIYGPTSTYVLVVIGTNDATGPAVRGVSDLVYRAWQGDIQTASSYSTYQLVAPTKLHLRSSPGGWVIKTIKAGTAIKVYWNKRGWVYVYAAGRKGYLYHSKMRLSNRYLHWGGP